VTVLNPVAVSASGKIDGAEPYSWEWDFAFDGTFNPEPGASEQTVTIPVDRYKYDSRITKTIALRPNGDDSKIQTKHIYIRPYSLGISAPNGEDSRYRYFKPPDSDLVEHFQWNFGGGSPTVIGRTQEHTYAESGDYHVTLTLQLYGGSAIKSDEYIWVGSGTRYIPGHTTYGDETWYTGGTYVVQGSITVAQGATLTIESGC
jgi:PKD repeat protein